MTRVPAGVFSLFRAYTVLVDEAEVGRLRRGGLLRLELLTGPREVRLTSGRHSSGSVTVAVEPAGTTHLVCGPGAPPAGGIALLTTPAQPLGDGLRRIGLLGFLGGALLVVASWALYVRAGGSSRVADWLAEAGAGLMFVWYLARIVVRREIRRAAQAGGRSS